MTSCTHSPASLLTIGPLQDPVTWYRINYTGTQMTPWDFQNKGTLTNPALLSFVLKVPLRHLRPSVIYSVPCDWILQRAYLELVFTIIPQVLTCINQCSHIPRNVTLLIYCCSRKSFSSFYNKSCHAMLQRGIA